MGYETYVDVQLKGKLFQRVYTVHIVLTPHAAEQDEADCVGARSEFRVCLKQGS